MRKIRSQVDYTRYFPENYSASRNQFLSLSEKVGAPLITRQFSDGTTRYSVDIAYFGPERPANAIIIVSGIHGVEGYAGAACQCALLDNLTRDPKTACILVHALNPWGYAHNRRTNENNVDLNRNFIDFAAGHPENSAYQHLNPLLLPSNWDFRSRLKPDASLYLELLRGNRKKLQDAITRGQYDYPDGLFYGGSRAEWSHEVWREILDTWNHLPLSVLDVHTGLGRHGKAALLTREPRSSQHFQRLADWFNKLLISTSDHENSIATSSGTLIDSMPAESQSLVMEFGTYSAVHMLNTMRREAVCWRQNMPKDILKPAFCPPGRCWRNEVVRQFLEITDTYTSMLSSQLH